MERGGARDLSRQLLRAARLLNFFQDWRAPFAERKRCAGSHHTHLVESCDTLVALIYYSEYQLTASNANDDSVVDNGSIDRRKSKVLLRFIIRT